MPVPYERSVPDVLHNIVGNIDDIFRSEVQLVRTEFKEEVAAAVRPAATLGAGIVLAVYAVGLMLLALVHALATVMEPWSAALLVGASVAVLAVLVIAAGSKGWRRVTAKSGRTVASAKESLRWAHNPNK